MNAFSEASTVISEFTAPKAKPMDRILPVKKKGRPPKEGRPPEEAYQWGKSEPMTGTPTIMQGETAAEIRDGYAILYIPLESAPRVSRGGSGNVMLATTCGNKTTRFAYKGRQLHVQGSVWVNPEKL